MTRSSAPPPASSPSAALRNAAARTGGIEKGVRVRVRSGPFAGKVGEVQEVDAKGAKIVFGGMSVYVERSQLVTIAEENDRPKMSSSHRRIRKA